MRHGSLSPRFWPRFGRAFIAVLGLGFALPARAQLPLQSTNPIAQSASVYAAYRADIAAIGRTSFTAPGDVERALESIARYKDDDLIEGWLAYGAISAAKSPAYAAGIASVEKRYGRAAVLKALAADPAYPSRRRGYADAAAAILDFAAADSAATRATAAHLDTLAGKPIAWADTQNGEARLAHLRGLGPPSASSAAITVPTHNAAVRPATGKTTITRRIATLAGMSLLNGKPTARLFDDHAARECVHMQRLQFLQCVSVTHDAGEATSCLAEHALRGVNGCLSGALVR